MAVSSGPEAHVTGYYDGGLASVISNVSMQMTGGRASVAKLVYCSCPVAYYGHPEWRAL
jgi:hypothetical protein